MTEHVSDPDSNIKTAQAHWHRFLAWISVIASVLATLISFDYIPLSEFFADAWGAIYLVTALGGNFFLIFALLAFPFWLLGYFMPGFRHWLKSLLAIVYALALLIVYSNAMVFEMYRFHFNGIVLNMLFGGALRDNLSFSPLMWGLSILIVVLSVIFLVFASHWLYPHLSRFRFGKVCVLVFVTLFLGANILHATADAYGYKPVTRLARYVPWINSVTAEKIFRKMGVQASADTQAFDPQGGAFHYPLKPLSCEDDNGIQKYPNILLITVDSLRFDMLSAEVMPNMYRRAATAMQFRNHISTSNGTRYGIFGMFYGLPGSYWAEALESQRGAVLFDRLSDLKYQFYIFSSAALTNPEFDRTVFSRIRNELQTARSSLSVPERDREISERLLTAIDQHSEDKPYFAFIFLDAPHAYALPENFESPFKPRAEVMNYFALDAETDPTSVLNLYKSTAYYEDQLMEQLFSRLEAKNKLHNTIVIFTSDHGQEFNDTGGNFWGHNSNFFPYQVQVPMLVWWPGREPGITDMPTSHEDLVPTLMNHALACTNDIADYSTGMDLFSDLSEDRVRFVESWSKKGMLYSNKVLEFDEMGIARVYDEKYQEIEEPSSVQVLRESLERTSRFLK